MLSIIHVTSTLQLGGAERFVIDLAGVQRDFGIDTSILSFGGHDDILVDEARRKNIPLHIHHGTTGRLWVYPPVFRLLQTADVIHIHSPSVLQYLWPLLMLLPSKKVIYTRHGEGRTEFRWKMFHWFAERFVDLATFVSASAEENFSRRYKWAAHKLRTIENGVYVPELATTEKNYPVRFGSVGRMVELKGQRHLLNAVHAMSNAGSTQENTHHGKFELHFFGSGPLENQLKRQAAQGANAASIFFHGTVLDREKIYDSIDVLVVSSESEGLSLVILEAMARGIPVIATAVGGNVSLVQPDVSGYLVDYGDPAAMLAALQKFIANPALIRVFGQSGRNLIVDRYSLEKTHQAYLKCYGDQPYEGTALRPVP